MKSYLTAFDRLVGVLSSIGAITAACALLLIATAVIWEVIARSIFERPTIWAIEVSTYAITAAGFLAAGYVLRGNGHLEITLITTRFSERTTRRLGVLTDGLGFLFCLVVTLYGYEFVTLSYLIGSTSVSELRVDLWIPQLSVPIGFGLMMLEFLCRIFVRLDWVSRVPSSDELALHD